MSEEDTIKVTLAKMGRRGETVVVRDGMGGTQGVSYGLGRGKRGDLLEGGMLEDHQFNWEG